LPTLPARPRPIISSTIPVTESGLVRGVLRRDTVALMINGIIGAGIFGLPSKIHALIGVHALLAYVICTFVVGCIALCCAEVSSRFTGTGGAYLYARTTIGALPAFGVGWLMWVTRVIALAVIVNVMVSYLGFFLPAASTGAWRVSIMTAVVGTLTVVNLVGVRRAAMVTNALTIGKLIPLLLFVGLGLFFVDPSRFTAGPLPEPGTMTLAVTQLMFAFAGFEATAIAAGEMRDPQRNIPFATLAALTVVAILYLLIQIVCIGTLPALGVSERPLADASLRFMGSAGASVIAAGAVISTLGIIGGILLVGPRLLFAIADQGQIPPIFARTHPTFHTPHVAILLTAAISLALAITGTFASLVTIGVLTRLTTYLATIAALLVLRRRGSETPALFRAPAGPFVSAVAAAACSWLFVNSGWRELRDVGIATLIGFALHGVYRWWVRPSSQP
jgi:amino acid transporter